MTDAAPTDYVASGSAAGEGAGLESDDDARGLPDRVVVAAAVVLSSAIVALPSGPDGGSPLIARIALLAGCGLLAIGMAPCARPRRSVIVSSITALCLLGFILGERANRSLLVEAGGSYTGWVRVVDDPRSYRSSTWLLIEVDGDRHEVWLRRSSQRARAESLQAGEHVMISGERIALEPDRRTRVAWQHTVGELRVDWLGDVVDGGALARSSNRVRALVADGAALIGAPEDSLLRGLVIGDDLEQPPEMIERFRRSGLSHLTAVSGQNVTLVLAASSPLLRRLRTRARLAVTIGLIAWFVMITRFEPSILRAGTMAILAAIGVHLGRERSPIRMLALAVTALVVIDPLITRSVGLWLSVGATAGVIGIGPRLQPGLSRLGVLATPVAVTLGAQLGVALPSLVAFGRLPLIGLVANLLAVPVAGLVMLIGLPACLLAGLTASSMPYIGSLILAPVGLGVRWVDRVAALGEQLEPASSIPGALVTLVLGGAVLGFARWSGAADERRGAMNEAE